MADTFNGIITADGKKRQLPYGSILEAPVSDPTLSLEGAFADSKAVGDKFKETKAETDSLKEDLNNYAKSAFRYIPTTENNKFCRWDTGKIQSYDGRSVCSRIPVTELENVEIYSNNDIYSVCFFNGETFVSGIALNGVDHFTIPEGCNRCVVDFNIITNLPNILVRDPIFVNKSPCYGKSLGCLGDSITQGVGNNNHSWVDAMKGMCGFKSVYNYGVSGNTIEQMYDRINTMENTLDYITLLGGTNNALWSNSQSISDFKASFDSLVSSIIEKYPTSKVLGIIPPKYNYSADDVTRNWNVSTSPNNLKLIDFVNAEIEIYSKYSVPIVNLFSGCNIQPDINAQKIALMPDGVHPNQKGYFDFIAPKIAEALNSI